MSLDILDTNIQKCSNIKMFPLHLKKVPKGSLCINFQVSFLEEKRKHLSFHQKLKFSLYRKSWVNVFLNKLVIIFSLRFTVCFVISISSFILVVFQVYILIHKISINLMRKG